MFHARPKKLLIFIFLVNYLLFRNHDHNAAISILTIYFLLLLLMASSFLRLAYITTFDPPYVALGPTATRDSSIDRMKARAGSEEDGLGGEEYEMDNSLDAAERDLATKNDPDSPGLESFYTKDVFVCEMDGRPRWCSECKNWKPDRAHHCSSAGRCIRKSKLDGPSNMTLSLFLHQNIRLTFQFLLYHLPRPTNSYPVRIQDA